jgi:SAM-dependent methyltransferase
VLPVRVSGTEGYAEQAATLVEQYESIRFTDLHREVFHLIPPIPSYVLDIGAGTGRDAAGFAAMGYRVVAVEPTAGLRTRAAALHPSPRIEWVDDSLPDLREVAARGELFDVIMLTAVWMHLDASQRQRALPKIAHLMQIGGVMVMSLRHGPAPAGRRMFEVSAEETAELAKAEGLSVQLILKNQAASFGRTSVRWTRLAFLKRAPMTS